MGRSAFPKNLTFPTLKGRSKIAMWVVPSSNPPNQCGKLNTSPLKDVLAGKRVLMVDDSIVRATTRRKIVKALRDAGATEVHMRISSPPVTHPCFYGIDTDNQDQLIAATKSLEQIKEQIQVDSLAYLS